MNLVPGYRTPSPIHREIERPWFPRLGERIVVDHLNDSVRYSYSLVTAVGRRGIIKLVLADAYLVRFPDAKFPEPLTGIFALEELAPC